MNQFNPTDIIISKTNNGYVLSLPMQTQPPQEIAMIQGMIADMQNPGDPLLAKLTKK